MKMKKVVGNLSEVVKRDLGQNRVVLSGSLICVCWCESTGDDEMWV